MLLCYSNILWSGALSWQIIDATMMLREHNSPVKVSGLALYHMYHNIDDCGQCTMHIHYSTHIDNSYPSWDTRLFQSLSLVSYIHLPCVVDCAKQSLAVVIIIISCRVFMEGLCTKSGTGAKLAPENCPFHSMFTYYWVVQDIGFRDFTLSCVPGPTDCHLGFTMRTISTIHITVFTVTPIHPSRIRSLVIGWLGRAKVTKADWALFIFNP